jgi:hypothetical protein
MTLLSTDDKWAGCPFDVKKHEKALKQIALGVMPDPSGRGVKYHQSRIELSYEWLKEQDFYKMERGV